MRVRRGALCRRGAAMCAAAARIGFWLHTQLLRVTVTLAQHPTGMPCSMRPHADPSNGATGRACAPPHTPPHALLVLCSATPRFARMERRVPETGPGPCEVGDRACPACPLLCRKFSQFCPSLTSMCLNR